MRLRTQSLVVVVWMLLFVVSACSSGDSPATSDGLTTVDQSQEAGGDTTAGEADGVTSPETKTTGSDIQPLDIPSEWSAVTGEKWELSGFRLDHGWLALILNQPSGDEVRAVQVDTDRVKTYAGGAGWLVQDVFVVGADLVVIESNDAELISRVVRIPANADTDADPQILSTEDRYIPWAVEVGDRLLRTTFSEDPEPTSCLRYVDEIDPVHCLGSRSIERVQAQGSVVSFVSYPLPPDEDACATLHWLDVEDADVLHDVETFGCVFSGVSDGQISGWSTEPVPDDQGYVDYKQVGMFAAIEGGEIVDLGLGSAGSAILCGDRLAWAVDIDGDPAELRTWTTGSEVTVVYRSPDEGPGKAYATSRPFCGDDERILIMRADWIDASDEILIQGQIGDVLDGSLGSQNDPPSAVLSPLDQADDARPSPPEQLSIWMSSKSESDVNGLARLVCETIDSAPADLDPMQWYFSDEVQQSLAADLGLANPGELLQFSTYASQWKCDKHLWMFLN